MHFVEGEAIHIRLVASGLLVGLLVGSLKLFSGGREVEQSRDGADESATIFGLDSSSLLIEWLVC